MHNKSEPEIIENEDGHQYTRIEFTPDLKRFGMDHLDADIVALMRKVTNQSVALCLFFCNL